MPVVNINPDLGFVRQDGMYSVDGEVYSVWVLDAVVSKTTIHLNMNTGCKCCSPTINCYPPHTP